MLGDSDISRMAIAAAEKSAGLWKFESLDIAFDQTSSKMTLLNEG